MGGETDLRGFDIRSISPVVFIPTQTVQRITYTDPAFLNAAGFPSPRTLNVPVMIFTPTLPGGDLQGFGNVEYRIPIVGPVTAALFADGGTNGILKKGGLKLDPTGFTSLANEFPAALNQGILSRQLKIASGTSFRPRGSTGIEFVVQLPIVQAPFRLYYAYNLNRLHQQIVSPPPFVDPSEQQFLANLASGKNPSLPPDVYKFIVAPTLNNLVNNPGRLNYFEPKTKLGFTVSRTF
jgi:outer membrane protein insertion porin family